MKRTRYLLLLAFFLSHSAFGLQWINLWQTKDQQAMTLLQAGKPKQAAQSFQNDQWQGVANYRAEQYEEAHKKFSKDKTSDGQYNAGNAAAFMGQYQKAIAAYDKAIALNANNQDAITNREIVKKLLQQQKQDQQKQDQQKQDQQKQDQQKQDQEKQNQQKQEQQKQDQEKQNQQKQDQQKQDQEKQGQEKQDQQNQDQQKQDQQKQDKKEGNSTTKDKSQPNDSDEKNRMESASQRESMARARQEDNKKTLNSIPDEPGGLLQQKFLRDYLQRHGFTEN